MEVISTYENKERKANVIKQSGAYSEISAYIVEYYVDNKIVATSQYRTTVEAEQSAELYTNCLGTDAKQFLSE